MKTLRMIGAALFAAFLALNFAACKDDDDNNGTDLNLLEGTWGLVNSKGWEQDDASSPKESFETVLDPFNPGEEEYYDCDKLVIKRISDNQFSVLYYILWHANGGVEWNPNGGRNEQQIFKVEANHIVIISDIEGGAFEGTEYIEKLTSDQLVIHSTWAEEDGEQGEVTLTYARMPDEG